MSEAETALKSALFDLIKRQVIKQLVAEIPFLGTRIISPLTSILVNKILTLAFKQTELALYFYKIDKETEKQAADVKQKQDNFDKAKTVEEIKKADDELKEALKNLIGLKPK
jgi:hypothetical protein